MDPQSVMGSRVESGKVDSEFQLRDAPVVESVTEEATYQLRRLILERRLGPGDRLPSERELVSILKASRTSVRSAINHLEAAGVVVVSARRGAFVNDGSPAAITASIRSLVEMQRITLSQLIEFRRAVEPPAAAAAARFRTDEDIALLAGHIQTMRLAVERVDTGAFVTADDAFHARVAATSRNPLFTSVLESVGAVIHTFRAATGQFGRPLLVRSLADHTAIFEAIRSGDQDGATAAMVRHIVETAVTFQLVTPDEVR